MPDPDEVAHLQRLLKIYQRNLQVLEGQAASYGVNLAPVAIQNQIEDTREKIAELGAKLNPGSAGAGAAPAPSTPVSPDAPPSALVTLDFQLRPDGALITWRSPGIGREETLFAAPYD